MLNRSGKTVVAVGVGVLAVGVLLNYPEVVAIGLALLALAVFAAVWMLASPDVRVAREINPTRVAEGEPAMGVLTVTNRSARRSPPLAATEMVGPRTMHVPVPSLPGRGTHVTSYPLPTDRRGVFTIGPFSVQHTDPLRLAEVGKDATSLSILRVHPRLHSVPPIPIGRSRDMEGATSDTAPRGGIAFHSLREYERGDDLRLVHWKATARTGTLMVRHNAVPQECRMMIVLDTSASPYTDESFEDAVRVAASLCESAIRSRFPMEFRTTGGVVCQVDRAGSARAELLDALTAVERSEDDPGLSGLARMTPSDDGVALGVVSGQPDAAKAATVGAVRSRYLMVSFLQVGEKHGRPGLRIPGALCLNVDTSDDFAAAWTRMVQR